MSEQTDNRNELISGWIDNRLNSQESAEFEALKAGSSEFAHDAFTAQQISNQLRTLPKRSLPPEFAKRITNAAVAAKNSADLIANQNSTEFAANSNNSTLAGESSKASWTEAKWAGIAAVAAGLLICIGLAMTALDEPIQNNLASNNLISNDLNSGNPDFLAQGDVQNSDPDSVQPGVASDAISNANVRNPESNDALVDNSASPTDSSQDMMDVIAEVGTPSENLASNNDKMGPDNLEMMENGGFAGLSEEDAIKHLQQMTEGSAEIQMLMVVDVSMTDQLWQNDGLAALFGRYDIPMSDPAVLDGDATDSLRDSRFVARNDQSGDRVSLVFVKADSARLDQAIQEIYVSYKDFPEISFDLAFDPPAQKSLKQLKSIEFFSEDESRYGALPLMADAANDRSGLVANFTAGNRPLNREQLANRIQGTKFGSGSLNADMNPVAYCLFVIRKSEGPSDQ